MTVLHSAVTWIACVAIAFISITAMIGIAALLSNRDRRYRKMYEEHLAQKARVEERIRRDKRNERG